MRHNWISETSLAATAGLVTAAAVFAAPAQADPIDDSFLSALGGSGVTIGGNPGSAIQLGQSICPMLAQPAGSVAAAASSFTGDGGMSPEMAKLFTSIAVSMYCPQMMSQLAEGHLPTLPQIPGMPSIPGL